MARVEKILFPVNFSASCVAMVPYVRRAASIFNATVSLVHVIDEAELDLFERYELYVRPIVEILEDHRIARQKKLASFLTSEFPVTESPRVLLTGDPAAEISACAREGNFDFIVMPTHAGRFRQTLLGSTTARVLNDAPCPVLTSRHAESIAPRPLTHRRWVCALDLTAYAETVLRTGKFFSEQARAELSLIHVVDFGRRGRRTSSVAEEGLHLEEVRRASAELGSLTDRHNVAASTEVVVGSPKGALVQSADQFDADVLIIGRSSIEGSPGRLTDLTYAVVRDSPCPVLSV